MGGESAFVDKDCGDEPPSGCADGVGTKKSGEWLKTENPMDVRSRTEELYDLAAVSNILPLLSGFRLDRNTKARSGLLLVVAGVKLLPSEGQLLLLSSRGAPRETSAETGGPL